MTVFRNDGKWDASNVWFEGGGKFASYDKKHPTPEMRHIELWIEHLESRCVCRDSADDRGILADHFSQHVARQEVKGFEVDQRFYEIGSHQGLQELDLFLRTPHPTFES